MYTYTCSGRASGKTVRFIKDMLALEKAGEKLPLILTPTEWFKQALIDAGIPEENILVRRGKED